MGFLGGKAGKQESRNQAYGWALNNYGGMATPANGAMNMAASILGIPGTQLYGVDPDNNGYNYYDSPGHILGMGVPPGAVNGAGGQAGGAGGGGAPGGGMGGLQSYFNSTGGQFQLGQGLDALTNKFSALGLTKSGAAMKGMEQFRQDLASTKLDNYLGQLNEIMKIGLGAGGLVTGAGQKSKGAGASEGAGPTIGAILGSLAAASDRRCKTKMERIGDWDERGDGLGKWRFAYKWAPTEMLEGVMADEVERLRPAAFIPNFKGEYAGVNYALLGVA